MAETRRDYETDVARIAAAMLGPYAQNQVIHTVESVFTSLWDQAHLLDSLRAGTAGWVCHLARRESLVCLRAGLPSKSVLFPDEPRFRILALELAGLPAGSTAELNDTLHRLPDTDRRLLVRRYAYYEDLDALALAARVDRGVLEARLADARTGLTATWSASTSPSRPMGLSDWDMLDPDLLPDAVPGTPLRLDPVSLPPAEQWSTLFPPENASNTQRARWPLLILALILLVAGFAVGFSLHPGKSNPPTESIVPTGPNGATGPNDPSNGTHTTYVALPMQLLPLLEFDWDTLSVITVVRTDMSGLDSYRLQDAKALSDLRTYLDGFRFEISNLSSESYGDDPRRYELIAQGPHDGVAFFALDNGQVAAIGPFLSTTLGLSDPNAILVGTNIRNYHEREFDRLALFLDSLKDTSQ